MIRILAIIERDFRKFFRSPALVLTITLFPIVDLLLFGHVMSGKLTGARVGVVNLDGGPKALEMFQGFDAIAVNNKAFTAITYPNEKAAEAAVRSGDIQAAIILPRQLSRRYFAGENPSIGVLLDNSDQFLSSGLKSHIQSLVSDINRPHLTPRLSGDVRLDVVELYPFVSYVKYILPGSLALLLFLGISTGGAVQWVEDKSKGVHEGLLVTPISRFELVLGLIGSGWVRGIVAGLWFMIVGALLVGLPAVFSPLIFLQLLLLIIITSFVFNALMLILIVRVNNPLLPNIIFTIAFMLLYHSSGAIFPLEACPPWLRAISKANPFAYAVHGFKGLLLKESGFLAVLPDFLFLTALGLFFLFLATKLFKRGL